LFDCLLDLLLSECDGSSRNELIVAIESGERGSTRLSCIINATRYYCDVIVSFRDAETKRIFEGRRSKKLPFDIQRTARRKPLSLAASVNLADLAGLPGNRFERLKDDRKGQ
jgi:hypothetical protein